jgi:predicted transposase YdaD
MLYVTSIERMAIAKERQTIARNMLKAHMPLEQIANLTGLTIEQIQAIQISDQEG